MATFVEAVLAELRRTAPGKVSHVAPDDRTALHALAKGRVGQRAAESCQAGDLLLRDRSVELFYSPRGS